ncbi:hypothetical protein V1511DRAFT_513761 [Dipodascopsis uninucleata]
MSSANKVLKRMAAAAGITLVSYIAVRAYLDDKRKQRYVEGRNTSFQTIAEYEHHSDGAANPSSEEVNDPAAGRKRR